MNKAKATKAAWYDRWTIQDVNGAFLTDAGEWTGDEALAAEYDTERGAEKDARKHHGRRGYAKLHRRWMA